MSRLTKRERDLICQEIDNDEREVQVAKAERDLKKLESEEIEHG